MLPFDLSSWTLYFITRQIKPAQTLVYTGFDQSFTKASAAALCFSTVPVVCIFFYYSDNIMSNRCPTATSESENVGRQKKKAILKLSPPHPPKNIRTSSLLLELNVSDASQGFLVSETDHKTLYIQSCCESYGVTFKIFSNSSLYHVDLSKPLDLTFFYNS